MLLPGPDLHRVEPLALCDFCIIFLPNTGEDQKKVLSKCGATGTEPCVRSVPVSSYCITFIKRLDQGLSNFYDKNPKFHSGCTVRLNWLADIKLKGLWPPGTILLLGGLFKLRPIQILL